jgi:hypothetical protein
MSLNPFQQVTDYWSMLSRLFVFNLLSGWGATYLLRYYCPAVDEVLKELDVEVNLWGRQFVKLGYLLPAIAFALFSQMFLLHDRISDWLKIRHRFDVEAILIPLREGTRTRTRVISVDKISQLRRVLMPLVFYRYAGSADPKIDKHLIYRALDRWSWYWVLIEALAVFLPAGIALLFSREVLAGLVVLLGCALVIGFALPFFRKHCVRYAEAEVRAILSDPERRIAVEQEFDALSL